MNRMAMLLGRYGLGMETVGETKKLDQRDVVLITYGDTINKAGEKPLATLRRFLVNRLQHVVSTVHILPFFPYSSDDGFSIINYRKVSVKLGGWHDIELIGQEFSLMVDLVLNHVSRQSEWFGDYVSSIAPARNYFIESDPNWDLSAVVRPRNGPLLIQVETRHGSRHLWTTFSDDQIDLNFANPDVLFEFLDILLFYIYKGARVIRLDAIAYLWKQPGTSCIHLPQTHEVVKLLRDVMEIVSPDVQLVTETNVPHNENIRYFGSGDESHMVYQFTLGPLLLHALQKGRANYLTTWAKSLRDPPTGCTFLNFTASHDGIGIRPLEGILSDQEIQTMQTETIRRGGYVSTMSNSDGSEKPYELNITYLDGLADPDNNDPELHAARFLCSQAVVLAMKGIPAIYFHSLVGTRNDQKAVELTNRPRSINRYKWQQRQLNRLLADETSMSARIFNEYLKLLRVRRRHTAFHPEAGQEILEIGDELFALKRTSVDQRETILAVHNFTDRDISLSPDDNHLGCLMCHTWHDLLSNAEYTNSEPLEMTPYQVMWLRRKSGE